MIDIRIKGRSGFSNPDFKISPRGSTAGNGTPAALPGQDVAKEIQAALSAAASMRTGSQGATSSQAVQSRSGTRETREIAFDGGRIEIAMSKLGQIMAPQLFEQAATVLQQSIGVRSLSRRQTSEPRRAEPEQA